MRNLKKFLALVLATLMVISAAATVSAYSDVADDSVYATAINTLSEYGIVKGIGNDEFGADLSVQRYQMALMMVRALEPESDWNVGGMKVFEDTPEEIYGNYFGAIAYARMSGIINGVDDTHFAPAAGIKYCDALIMAVRALGYTVDVTVSPYWMGAYQTATKLGLTKNIDVIDPAQILTRAQTAQVIYNMIKATPADGGATIEEKNFGVPGDSNVTKYVITSTPKQYYATKTVEAGYVGAQPLVNGVPNGDTLYIPVAALGIEADEVENYFNYSVDLVNLNAKTGRYDKAILGAAPTEIYSNDVTIPDGTSKFVLNGTSYYPTAEFAGEALKNEIVIFNGGSTAGNTRILLTDADGDIIKEDGTKVAIFAYQAPDGTKYYADKINAVVISYAEALVKYGVDVSGTYTRYSTLKLADLKNSKNYQLSMFDDNGDGKYDRAIYTNVYMSVYPGSVAKDKATGIVGPAKDAKNITIEGADLAKGDVFVYTWNVQTNTISVIEKLEAKVGTVTNIDLTDYKKDKGFVAKITIDGVTYKLGNSAQDSKVGATLQYTGKVNDAISFADIANAKLNYINNELTTANVIEIFSDVYATVRYYEFNGYIISAELKSMDEGYEYMVVVGASDYDTKGVYVDAYINGKRDTYYINAYTDDNGNVVKFADLSVFRLNVMLSNFANQVAGNVYKAVANTDGESYTVSRALKAGNETPLKTLKFALKEVSGSHTFKDGISGTIASNKATRIRTDANTKFYFIHTTEDAYGVVNAKVTLYTGKPSNDWAIDADKAEVYVDYLGFGAAKEGHGVAQTVIVFYRVNAQDNNKAVGITGFNVNDPAKATVYIANTTNYTIDSASAFGLTGKTGTYFKFSAPALNMVNGSTVTVYAQASKGLVVEPGFYKIDSNGILLLNEDGEENIVSTSLKSGEIDLDNQYITFSGKIVNLEKATKLYTTLDSAVDVKTDLSLFKKDESRVVKYLSDSNKDGSVVLVVYAKDPGTKDTSNATVSAKWYGQSGSQYVAIADLTSKTIAKISGTAFVAIDKDGKTIDFTEWAAPVTIAKNANWDLLTAKDYDPKKADVSFWNEAGEKISGLKFETELSIEDGVLSFTITEGTNTNQFGSTTVKLPEGNVYVRIAFENGAAFVVPVKVSK